MGPQRHARLPPRWELKISTSAAAPVTSFYVSVSHAPPDAGVPAFSVHVDGSVFSGTIAGAGGALSAAVVDFGLIPSGGAAGRIVRLVNSGTEAIHPATPPLNLGGVFAVSGLVPATVLPPNGFLDLDVTYAPTGAPAIHTGTLAVDTVGGGCGLACLDALVGVPICRRDPEPASSPIRRGKNGQGC